MNKDDILYGLEDDEHLSMSIKEVLDRVIDAHRCPESETWERAAKRVEWPVSIHEFKRMTPSHTAEDIAERCILDVMDTLDAEYGDPDGDATEPTEAVKASALAFGKAVLADYVSWACEKTGKVIVVDMEEAWRLYSA